ncbi:MAG: type II toxin-antitoxin system VapC family toxin [Actinomycetes bacterium]
MIHFVDSSALVKLYADEEGHQLVRRLAVMVVSHLTRVEVPAALWRKQRIGELSPADVQVLRAEFEADWFGSPDDDRRFVAVAATSGVLDDASRLTGIHGLRAYDAIQLASARAARAADPACGAVAAFDDHLRAAAAAEGFALVP